jgi:hypothetical protein
LRRGVRILKEVEIILNSEFGLNAGVEKFGLGFWQWYASSRKML